MSFYLNDDLIETVSWAIEAIDIYDTLLLEMGATKDTVYSAAHVAAMARAQRILAQSKQARSDPELINNLGRIIRILNRQVKRGGPSNIEEVSGHWMDEDLKRLYRSIVAPSPLTAPDGES